MDFKVALARVLLAEGGVSDDASDPGGHTDHGITQARYDEYRISKGLPKQDVVDIDDAGIEAFYRECFWDKVEGDDLPDAVAFQAMDFAVNSGPETAVRYLQRAAGVADDGIVGPHTIEALRNAKPAALLFTFLAFRLQFLTRRKNWPQAGAGWANRIANDMLLAAKDIP